MPDSEPQVAPGTDAGGVASLGIGERLRSARKARALTLEQAAETLHLDESVILALEEERFEALGAPVFVRGHLRAYARLLHALVDQPKRDQ
jgi:cytoskeleton protein RodZ